MDPEISEWGNLLEQTSSVRTPLWVPSFDIVFNMWFSRYVLYPLCFLRTNGDGEIRTLDPLLARQVLKKEPKGGREKRKP